MPPTPSPPPRPLSVTDVLEAFGVLDDQPLPEGRAVARVPRRVPVPAPADVTPEPPTEAA